MSTPSDAPTNPLTNAVMANDLTSVGSLYSLDTTTYSLDLISELACRYNQPEILTWAFAKGLVIPTSSENSSLFHAAIESASIPIFSILISHGFDVNDNWSEFHGDSLSTAVENGDLALAKFLLENGINPNTGHGPYGDYINIIVTLCGEHASNDMVKLMLEYGFKPQGTPAAIAAAETGNVEALELFVEAGAGLEDTGIWWAVRGMDTIDCEGTALYRACRAGKVESVKWLLGRGANCRAVDQAGRSCEDVAIKGGFGEIVALLREKMKEDKP